MASRGRRTTALCAIIAATLFGVGTIDDARAQQQPTPPTQPPRGIVTPELVTKEEPKYPDSGKGEATVVIDAVVNLEGNVENVTLVEGQEPFAASALDVVRRYKFKPATQAGKPVKARIRIAVAFKPPEPTPEPEPEPPPPPPPDPTAPSGWPAVGKKPEPSQKPAPAAPQKYDEVHILGKREVVRSPTEHRLGRAEVRVIPGAFGDPFRAIDILPGLVPIISGLPYFYIRGAPPSAVGYYIDEVRVPYLFHFALGPGVIQPSLIEEVTLHPAAFPGRFGRYAGGIVAGSTRDPATKLTGEAQIRLIDAGAYVEAPFANGRATAGVGGRYSYTAAIISLFAPNTTIDYRDYNARASYAITDRTRLSVFTFGSYDYASDIDSRTDRERVFFASEFHRVDVRLDHRGNESQSRVAATFGVDRTRLESTRFAQNWVTGLRGRHRWRGSDTLDLEVGADLLAEFYTGDLPSPFAVGREEYAQAYALFAPRTDTATGGWFQASWRPYTGWDITATLRGDIYTSAGSIEVGPSPRFSTRIPIVKRVTFLSAMGIAPQPPAFAIPVPAVGYRGLPGGLGYAYQKSAGIELALPLNFIFKTVGFHHSYIDLRDFGRERDTVDFDDPQVEPSSPSQAFGAETSLNRKLSERYAAFSSFTLMRSQLGSTRFSPSFVSPFDRTYVFQVGGVADLGRGWRSSARFLTYGGWPGERNRLTGAVSERLDGFYRIDLRIEKRWTLAKERWIGLILEGLNVTGSKDIVSRQCDIPDEPCRNEELGPIIVPSIGVEAGL